MKITLFLLFAPLFALSQNCQDIKMMMEKNVEMKVFESPDSNAVQFTKDIKGKMTVYRARFRMHLHKIDLGQKGVTIFFEDGTKLLKPDETVDVNNLDDNFEFTASLTLNPEELALFQKKKITGFLLFIYQKDLTVSEGEKFRNYANCIIAKK